MANEHRGDVVVVGLGYVGLPLCETLCRAGFRVTGVDTDTARVQSIAAGRSPITDLASDSLVAMRRKGFSAKSEFSPVETAKVVVLCLPTPLNDSGEPDLSSLVSGIESLAPHVKNEILIVIESTVAPGTTDRTVLDLLSKSGKKLGKDFFLAYSPERVNPGSSIEIQSIPKIVSGVDGASLEKARMFYLACGFSVVVAESTRDAEAAKLIENTYRAINIAFVSELAQAAPYMGVDIGKAIELAATKPFGFSAFYPGAGVGGHCIPIDPVYLRDSILIAGGQSKLLSTTLKINGQTPFYVASKLSEIARRLQAETGSSMRVTLLGMTYKPDVNDFRESPGIKIAGFLEKMGLDVSYHDPFLHSPIKELGPKAVWIDHDPSSEPDAVIVLLQNHACYSHLDLESLPASHRLCAGVSSGPWTSIWAPSMTFGEFGGKVKSPPSTTPELAS